MIDIFKIGGKVEINGIDKANSKLSAFANAAGKVASKIGKGLATAAKVAGAAVATVSAGVVALGKSSLDAYADYEQLVGGIETLFGDSADTIKKYASEAYKTAGISANSYMEQATSFSASLLQSLQGDTAAAAEITNMAIVDMADNANKMGTALESIQNAYQGFAKQNYTMLDNLKLGYGGTKEEMERLLADAQELTGVEYDIDNLADVYNAIHAIQTEIGITGTTALEASTTISGSIATMKSAWQNMLAGFADENADIGQLSSNFASSIATVLDNIVPRIVTILPNLTSAFETLIQKLLPILPPLIQQILPALVTGAITLVQGIVNAFPSIINALMDCLPTLIKGVITLVQGVVAAMPTIVSALMDCLPTLIDGILAMVDGIIDTLPDIMESICEALPTLIPQLLDGILKAIISLCENFSTIIQPIIDMLPDLITNIVDTLIDNLPALIQGVIQLVLGIVGAVGQIIETIVPIIPDIIIAIVGAIIENIPAILVGIWEIIKAVLGVVWTLVESIWDILVRGWNWLVDNVFAPIGNWIYDNVIAPIANFFVELWTGIKNTFSNVASWFSNVFTNAWNGIKKAFSSVGSFFTGIWDKIKNIFSKAGKSVGDAVSGAFATAINWVLEKAVGIINGFIKGINACIGIINKIPGVNIKTIKALDVPELEKGGVLERGQVGLLEGTGAEAVVPLDQNKAWIHAVARDMQGALGSNQQIQELKESFDRFVAELPEMLLEAFLSMRFDINSREFARMVKAVN